MSKQGKRKITVELPKSKDLSNRPSVFERLGTKKSSSSGKKTTEHCRQWAQHGTCAYGKSCKFASTHILISPSKQRAAKDNEQKKVKDDGKNRLHSTVVVRSGRSPDGEIDNWDQNDLEYADTDVLEKRRQQLQRELELQLKMDSGKETRKVDKKKPISSSSSSRSSSSSSASSSSSGASSSSSSSAREARRKGKKGKLKRNSSSSSEGDVPSKKKFTKSDLDKRDKSEMKKTTLKKDDKLVKKHDPKKKVLTKGALGKKSLSPGKKSGGTPPITAKSITKNTSKHVKSPVRRERKSISPQSSKDRDKDRPKERDKEREKEKDKNRARSRSVRKARSRSPRRHESKSKDQKRKESIERSRQISPKKPVRKDDSSDRPKKRSPSRARDHKSTEKRKEKHDDKDRHDRKDRLDRGRDRTKDTKRDDSKRRGRERGLGNRSSAADKGLKKPNEPMERLLPRPEERLAALAAISNRSLDTDKNSSNSKDRQDTHSERGGRKQDRERDLSMKRDRMDSLDREHGDYDIGMERPYDHGRGIQHYDRGDDRYDDGPRENDRSPGDYGMQGRERHFDAGYDMPGPPRGYPEDDDRMYGEHIGDRIGMGYDERRHRDHSWEGRGPSMDRERGYMHPHKEWDNEDYRTGGDWGRERHWPMHDPQRNEWADKDQEMEGWHRRGHPGPHRGRVHDNFNNRGMRMDIGNKRRPPPQRTETEPAPKEAVPPPQTVAPAPAARPPAAPAQRPDAELDLDPVPDDLSEISDDPDDILNREDLVDQTVDEDSQLANPEEKPMSKPDALENQSTQDTSGAGEEKESQDAKDDDDNLDFEEISDGELEEERTRAGLGDALGVDWASLVADVRRREQPPPSGGARDRWRPERVLARLGLSVQMAGADTVRQVLAKAEDKPPGQNGTSPEQMEEARPVEPVHPVAAIQVATEKRKRQRAVLFGSGCEITRALSARRDLALRRHLCRLPAVERVPHSRPAPQPDLFHAARAMLMQAPVSG